MDMRKRVAVQHRHYVFLRWPSDAKIEHVLVFGNFSGTKTATIGEKNVGIKVWADFQQGGGVNA